MYRIVLACKGVPAHACAAGARDISNEFTRRARHANLTFRLERTRTRWRVLWRYFTMHRRWLRRRHRNSLDSGVQVLINAETIHLNLTLIRWRPPPSSDKSQRWFTVGKEVLRDFGLTQCHLIPDTYLISVGRVCRESLKSKEATCECE
jgi:hypothetical protein